jgi:hypothetical protein
MAWVRVPHFSKALKARNKPNLSRAFSARSGGGQPTQAAGLGYDIIGLSGLWLWAKFWMFFPSH